ncbi:hypothetical protein GGU10DRAFT_436109 [Lentinula aff. detonsa]|uniref:Uncharacterized protein n=1 Tax=Lentinula aff. detonsa TaxID=2804958 RepID=A0AA38NKV6_9AGAR|nr:hypothetical protein GGU10DRAFT_436109 [Lentinula aff. detonsa]
MSPPMSSAHWLDISFCSRFSLPPTMTKPTLTRPPATRRSSAWEVPLAKSVVNSLACESENVFETESSAALCVQETRDVFAVDPLHEAEVEDSEYALDDCDSEYGAMPILIEEVSSAESEFNASLDDHVLYSWTLNRTSLVIDSTTPWLTPHIVITPASDTMSDLAIAWSNQPCYYPDASRLCLLPSDFTENTPSPYPTPNSTATSPPPLAHHPTPVFSPSRFNAMIESCSDERLSYFNVVIAVRRQVVKAVAIMASQAANTYRERYGLTLPFSNIERPFSWSDPAEPILTASRFLRATIIIDSSNPFRVPHIIINQPPPEDQWLTASNTINDPQNYGFGRFLVVHARGVNYINEPEDEYPSLANEETEYYDTSRFDEEGCRGWVEYATDHDESCGESYTSTVECYSPFEDLPELDTESLTSVESPSVETPEALDDEYFESALERASEKQEMSSTDDLASTTFPSYFGGGPLERPTCKLFDDDDEIDQPLPEKTSSWADEEDDLPSLDDEWYQSVIRRTQSVADS